MHFFSQIVFSAVVLASYATVNATPYPAARVQVAHRLGATKGIEIPAPTIAPLIARQYRSADYRGAVDPQVSSRLPFDVVPAISSTSESHGAHHAQATRVHPPPKRQLPSLNTNTITAMEGSLAKDVPAVPALPAIP